VSVRCRACGAGDPEVFYRQSGIPLNSCLLIRDRAAATGFPTGDLELACCSACGFIQNNRFVDHSVVYSPDYEETQAFSPRFIGYVDRLIEDQDRKYGLAGKTVLEIGCGKGDFLERLVARTQARGIGIDPAFRPGRSNGETGERLTFIQDFYGPAYAHLRADHVVCRHTLEHIPDVAGFLGMSPHEVDSVATFYNLIFRRPVGRHVIFVCDSVSCWIMGYETIYGALKNLLGIEFGQTTEDDRFTLLPIPCLGTCDRAPALMIDDDLHRDLDPGNLGRILERYP